MKTRPPPAATTPAKKPGKPVRRANLPGEIRIIGGLWKRTKLTVPDVEGLRPTPDRVRETLFNWLGQDLAGWRMDETTVVLETGLDEAVSFNKGCYIGQEIIARIHFRGHVAKKLTGLILEKNAQPNDELKSPEGKSAGKITSVTFSPKLEKHIALAYVRYEFLAENTELRVNDSATIVKNLPFVS